MAKYAIVVMSEHSEATEQLGVPIVGGEGQHHTVAALAADGYQILTF